MIIQLKQGYTDESGRKKVHLMAGTVTAALPRPVMEALVKAKRAKKIGDRQTGPERRAAAGAAPKPKAKKKSE